MRKQPVMTQIVFEDADGVVHARYFQPETLCGTDVIAASMTGPYKSHQVSLLQPTLPAVTCITCLTAMDT